MWSSFPAVKGRRAVPVVILLAALSGCGPSGPQAGPEAPAVPVTVAAAAAFPAAQDIVATGLLREQMESRLSFKVGGGLRSLKADTGDVVKAGQLLAELDPAEIKAQRNSAEEALARAERDLARARQLEKQGFVSVQRRQDAETAAAQARAAAEQARFNATFARITAPHDGVILARQAEENEIVAAGAPVITLGAKDGAQLLRVGLSDRDVSRLKLGDPAQIRFASRPGEPVPAVVDRIAGAADARTGAFDVELLFQARQTGLSVGMPGEARISPHDNGAMPLGVPATAVLEAFGPVGMVYVMNPKDLTVTRRRVGLGPLAGDKVVVTSGLTAGEQVVVKGAAYLRDGVKVKAGDPTAATP